MRRRSTRRPSLAVHAAQAVEGRARRSSAFLHGHLAGFTPAQHAGSVLLAGNASATTALQVNLRCGGCGVPPKRAAA